MVNKIFSTFILMLMITCTACDKEDKLFSFYVPGLGIQQFKIRKENVIIKAVSEAEVNAILKQDALLYSGSWNRIWVIASIVPKRTSLGDVLKMQGVADAAYGLVDTSGSIFLPTDQIAVQCKEGYLPESVLAKAGLADKVKTIERPDWLTADIYTITLDVKLRDIFKVCNDVFETKMCVFAAPCKFGGISPGVIIN